MKTKASFIEPILLLRTEKLRDGTNWLYELKFDGYRAVAFKSSAGRSTCARATTMLPIRYPAIAKALAKLPDDRD